MSTSFYDIVVIGTDLAGLICGAMAARRGYRVLVIGQNNLSNSYNHNGFQFTKIPHLFYGFEHSHWVKQVFAELSLTQEMRHRPKKEYPNYQVLFPGHRFTAWDDEALYEAEFRREFPGQVGQIREFFERIQQYHREIHPFFEHDLMIPPGGFRERREFNKVLSRFPLLSGRAAWPDFFGYFPPDHPFRSYVIGPLLFISMLHGRPLSPIQLVRHTFHLHQGLYHIEGGIDSLKSVFFQMIRNYCGDYKPHHVAGTFNIRRGRIFEIDVRNKAEVIGCNMVIGNCDLRELMRSIPDDSKVRKAVEPVLDLRPKYYMYSVNFGVNERVVPEGLCPRSFYFPTPQAPFLNEEMIYLNVNKDFRGFDENKTPLRSMTACMRILAEEAETDPGLGIRLRRNVCERMARLIPFFNENLVQIHSPWEVTGETGRLDVRKMSPIYDEPLENTLDCSVHGGRTGLKNLLIGGSHLHGGLGFEGWFLAGLMLYRSVLDSVPLKKAANP